MRWRTASGKPPKIPVSVLVVIHTPDGQILLLERADRPGFWQSVTGSLDAPDEPLALAAAREVFEETGLRVDEGIEVAAEFAAGEPALPGHDSVPVAAGAMEATATPAAPGVTTGGDLLLQDLHIQNRYEIFAHWRHRYGPGVTHNTEHVFALPVPAPCAVRLAPREHLAFAWLPWAEAAARCFSPSNAGAIRLLAGRLGWCGRAVPADDPAPDAGPVPCCSTPGVRPVSGCSVPGDDPATPADPAPRRP